MTPIDSIKRILQPTTIAVVGGRFAEAVLRQCHLIGFQGKLWPINPSRTEMEGHLCYPNIESLPEVPDAVFVAVSADATIQTVEMLSKCGAGGAVCYASGFAEIGSEGEVFQEQLKAAKGEMAIVGPNCYGLLNYLDGVALWPDEHGGKRVQTGAAIIAQSGNIAVSLSMQQRSLSLAYLISVGNQAGVTIPEFIETLLEDERVTAIGIHLEGVNDVAAFSQAAIKALEKHVPIVVIKTGASALGSQIAMSHTSSLAGSDALYDVFFERFGIVRVHTLPQFLETLKFMTIVGPLPNNRIASISCSGGEAGLVADLAERIELTFPPLEAEQQQSLQAVLGDRVVLGNPLDYHTYIWGDEEAQYQCFSAMLRGKQAVTIKIMDYPQPDNCDPSTWIATGQAFVRAVHDQQVRGVLVVTLQENFPVEFRKLFLESGIAPMLGLEECLIAIQGAVQVHTKQQQVSQIQPIVSDQQSDRQVKTFDEEQSKMMLRDYGIPIPNFATCTAENAVQIAEKIDFPVAVKVLSESIVHKSDVGGVHLNLQTSGAVKQAIAQMKSLGDRFLVEAMAAKPLVELILGITRDPQFGLVLVIGAGGMLVEILQDSITLLFPIHRVDVERALDRLKIAPLLNGYRGQPEADKVAIVETTMNLVRFVNDHESDMVEIDINPLLVLPQEGVLAVDAMIRMAQ